MRDELQADDDCDHGQGEARAEYEEALEAALRQSEQQQQTRWNKTKDHLKQNWIAIASLLILAVYTGVTAELWLAQLKANRINGDLYMASTRPWVMLTGIEPISLMSDDKAGVRLFFEVFAKNVGHGPAQSIWVSGRLLIDQFDPSPDQVMLRECVEDKSRAKPGPALFPDQPGQFQWDAGIAADRVWAARAERIRSGYDLETAMGRPRMAHIMSEDAAKFPFNASLYLVGCVNYRFSGDDIVHQTSFSVGVITNGPFALLGGEEPRSPPPAHMQGDPDTMVTQSRRISA